jgi:hypothetical protein
MDQFDDVLANQEQSMMMNFINYPFCVRLSKYIFTSLCDKLSKIVDDLKDGSISTK